MKKTSLFSRFGVAGCAVLFLLSSHFASGQKGGAPNDLDKNYIPDKNSVLNAKGSVDKSDRGFDCKNIIEFTPGLLIRNIFAVQYEHKFNEYLSLQGGLGFVYGKDLLQSVINSNGDFFGNSSSTIKLGELLDKGTTLNKTAYLSAAIRVYTGTGGYYGYYDGSGFFEMGIRHYSNNLQISNKNSSGSSAQFLNDPVVDIISNIYYLSYGGHLETDGKLPTTHNFYLGFGIRTTSYNSFTTQGYNSYNSNAVNVMSATDRSNFLNPMVLFGYELGFGIR
jgi:hypothetical protein